MAELLLHLSVPDQRVARSYVQTLFVFPFCDSSQKEDAVKALGEGLHVTLARFPYLAGTLGPEDPKTGKLTLRYPATVTREHVDACFSFESLSDHKYEYTALKARGMPTSTFVGTIFAPRTLREHPGVKAPDVEGIMCFKDNVAPVIGVAAFFIPGGLVLSTYTHHTVMDGTGRSTFLKHFARDVRLRKEPQRVDEVVLRDESTSRRELDARIPKIQDGQPAPAAEVYGNGRIVYKKTLPEGTPCAGNIFVISRKRMRDYRDMLIAEGVKTERKISVFSILCALIWIHITRARQSHLQDYDETSIAIAVDLRKRLSPPLIVEPNTTYMGNLALGTKATMSIADLVAEERVTKRTIIPTVQCINRNIAKVNMGWITQHLTYLGSAAQITDTELALKFSFGPDLYMTSWLHFDAYEDWGLPGVQQPARPEFFRRSHSEIDGGIVFLPRRNDPEAPYEILVRIAEPDMCRLLGDEDGLSAWCENVI